MKRSRKWAAAASAALLLIVDTSGCKTRPLARRAHAPVDLGGLPPVCRRIYVVDEQSSMFSAFDPIDRQFEDIGKLDCPDNFSEPETMGVARDGFAWVFFRSHQLFRVDVGTGVCQGTGFDGSQIGRNDEFGSAFSADEDGTGETLFLALPRDRQFARLDRQALRVDRFGVLTEPAELAGDSTGALWVFEPGPPALASPVDKTSGAFLNEIAMPKIGMGGGFAVALWGGGLWIFQQVPPDLATAVYRLDLETGDFETVLTQTGRHIVGAGASTCAPIDS